MDHSGFKRPRPPRKKIIESMISVFREYNPGEDLENKMTLRQIFYQLVARQVIENHHKEYKRVKEALVHARKSGMIPWSWIEDRTRQPRTFPMWRDLSEFSEDVLRSYRKEIWNDQPLYVELWLEKEALSGIFMEILEPFGITLNVGRGNDSYCSIISLAERCEGKRSPVILCFTDFDPTGEDMRRDLRERLAYFGCRAEIVPCALLKEDIGRYSLPSDFAKKSDSRTKKFIEKYGEEVVELDSLPVDVLKKRILEDVKVRIDPEALERSRKTEERERLELQAIFEQVRR
ncbi:hypothetical protein ES703_64278 [subsurface metagenome]